MRRGRQLWVLAGLALFAGCLLAPAALRAGVVGSPHDFSDTTTNPQHPTRSTQIAPEGVCSACHIPHGADSYTLWSRNLDVYRSALANNGSGSTTNYVLPPTIQCYDCHDYHGGVGGLMINDDPPYAAFDDQHKPQDIAAGFTRDNDPGVYDSSNMAEDPWIGSVSGYYENKPPPYASSYGADANLAPTDNAALRRTGGHYFKRNDPTGTAGDAFDIGDKLPCRDCHDPHAWASDWQAFIKPNLGGATGWSRVTPSGRPTASRYMANDFITSGARDDSNSRTLCIACHGNSDTLNPVSFSDVSSAYSSSAGTVVRPPNSIVEHRNGSAVACVSCHTHNSVDASCGDCHGFPPSVTAPAASRYPANFTPSPDPDTDAAPLTRGSHPKHTGARAGEAPNSFAVYSFPCETCHYASTGTGSGMGYHGNDNVSVIVMGAYTKIGGTYDSTNYYNQGHWPAGNGPTGQLDNSTSSTGWGYTSPARAGWNSCQFVYCHSAGRVKSSIADNEYRRPQFNTGPLGCNGCHGDPAVDNTSVAYGMPNYPSGAPGSDTANTHNAHVVNAGYECSVCHAGTATGAGANRAILDTTPTLHVNLARDVQFDGAKATGTYDNNPATKTCHVSCHGSDNPRWGGTLVNGCFSCHAGAEPIEKPQDNTNIPNPVDNNEYLYSGHGRSASPPTNYYPGSGNAPAGFSNYTVAPVSCYLCHSQEASHTTKSARDPFRLGSSEDATTGGMGTFTGAWADNTDLLCLGCHGTAAQRSGHDNIAAKGSTTVDAQTHARGITGTKYTWPVTPWKCVDCHDPHGDGKSGVERYMMVRSAINAPSDNTDSNAGSDAKSRPKRTTGLRAVAFYDNTGFGAGSYAQSGNSDSVGPWGPCEVCHTQTTAYNRKLSLDNTASHATRTSRCTTCHPHKAGFAATACRGCHGPDGVAATAPDISEYWTTSGHGRASITTLFGRTVECEDCHDAGYLTAGDHKTDGSAGAGPPPANINTQTWPGKPTPTADTTPNLNTAHLKSVYINAAPASRADIAITFDNYCATGGGCHNADYHRHQMNNGPAPQNVMRFGDKNTVPNPKAYGWYTLSSYPTDFYRSQSPWTDNDIRLQGGLSDAGTSYGLCVSCHDPHGTPTTNTSFYPGLGTTNHMVRGNWVTESAAFCNTACHTKRNPP